MRNRQMTTDIFYYEEGEYPTSLYEFVQWVANLPTVHRGDDHEIHLDGAEGRGGWLEVHWKRLETEKEMLCRLECAEIDKQHKEQLKEQDWTHHNAELFSLQMDYYKRIQAVKDKYKEFK